MKSPNILRYGLFVGAILCSPAVFAESPPQIQIDDGATVLVDDLICGDTFVSTVEDNNATGTIEADGATVTLSGDLSGFYGYLQVDNGCLLTFSPLHSGTGAKVNMLGPYTATTTLAKGNGTYSLSGYDGSGNTIELGDYAVLDLTASAGPLTLAQGLYLSSHDMNAGRIRFSANPNKGLVITTGTISSSDLSGQISADRHVIVDFTDLGGFTPVYGSTPAAFTLATASAPFVLSSSTAPAITGNNDGLWQNFTLLAGSGSGQYNLKVSATFSGALFRDDLGGYHGTLAGLQAAATPGGLEQLLQNWAAPANQTLTKCFMLDLGSYNITGASYAFQIPSGQSFSLLSSAGGQFGAQVTFSDVTSLLKLIGNGPLSSSFSVGVSGGASGQIQLGDGTSVTTQTLRASQLSNVGTIRVLANSTLTLTQAPE
jgi:hypothetical protein